GRNSEADAFLLVLQVRSAEFLHALPGTHLRGENVSLAVDGDVVHERELANLPSGTAEAAERLFRSTLDNAHFAVHAVDHVDEFLVLVGREHEIEDRARAPRHLFVDVFEDESAVLAEYLQAVIRAVTDVDKTVLVDTDTVDGVAKLRGWRAGGIIAGHLLVARLLAVGTPMALVSAGFAIEYCDAAVGVAVRGIDLPCPDICGDVP